MTQRELTRRSIVRRSLAAASAGTVLGLAGCSEVTDQLDSGGSDDATPGEATESEPEPQRVYADWLPAPADIDDTSDHYPFFSGNIAAFEANEDRIDENSYDPSGLEDTWSPLEFRAEDTSRLIGIDSSVVVEAAFDADEAISTLEAESFEADSEYNGHTLMAEEFGNRVFAVGDGTLLITAGTDTAETILDAKSGDGERYDEASDDMSTLVGELGGGATVRGRTMGPPDRPDPEFGQFENMVARGRKLQIDGDRSFQTWVIVYGSSEDVATDDLETWVDTNGASNEQFGGVEDINYTSEGRVAIITGRTATSDV